MSPSYEKGKGAVRKDENAPERRNYPREILGKGVHLAKINPSSEPKGKEEQVNQDQGTKKHSYEVERTSEWARWIFSIK